MNDRIPFVYQIVTLSPLKSYIGSKTSKGCRPADLGVTYFGSSTHYNLKQMYIKNPDNFIFVILEVFDSIKNTINKEVELHARFNVGANSNFYNIARQLSAGFSTAGTKDKRKLCQFCNKKYSIYHLKRHEKYCVQNPNSLNIKKVEKTKKCPYCKKMFAPNGYSKHIPTCSLNPNKQALQYKKHKKEKCKYCGKLIGSGAIKRHENACNKNPNKIVIHIKRTVANCIFCNKEISLNNKKAHERSCPKNPNKLEDKKACTYCGKLISVLCIVRHEKHCHKNPNIRKGITNNLTR